jgi:glycosyltransferase involved in cell wall biosynthesis
MNGMLILMTRPVGAKHRNEDMKLFVVSESPLEKIGAEYYAVDTWIRFIQLMAVSEQVTVLSPVIVREAESTPSRDAWRVQLKNLRIEHLDFYNSFAKYYLLLPRRIRVWQQCLDRLVAEHDAVILRLPSPMMSLVTKSVHRQRKPLIMMVAGNLETQSDRIIQNRGFKRLFYLALAKLLVFEEIRCARHAAIVYVYSDELAHRHASTKGRLIRVRTPHLSAADFMLREDTCQSREIRLLRVAWLVPSKGIELLLQVIALLLAKGLCARLEIVGKERFSGYQAQLERLAEQLGIRDQVEFTGWIPFDKIREKYVGSDIQVISSLSEGTPRCIIEGAACGLPIVSTTAGGCPSVLTDAENGLLVPPGDPQAMADAVERLIRDGALRRKLIKQGYEMAQSATFENLGRQFLNEIRNVVQASR